MNMILKEYYICVEIYFSSLISNLFVFNNRRITVKNFYHKFRVNVKSKQLFFESAHFSTEERGFTHSKVNNFIFTQHCGCGISDQALVWPGYKRNAGVLCLVVCEVRAVAGCRE